MGLSCVSDGGRFYILHQFTHTFILKLREWRTVTG